MGNENPNMQPDVDKLNDAGRDVKRRGSAKKKDEIKFRKKVIIAISTILIFSTLMGFVGDVLIYKAIQINEATNTPKAIYKTLEVDNLLDLIEIKGDEKERILL